MTLAGKRSLTVAARIEDASLYGLLCQAQESGSHLVECRGEAVPVGGSYVHSLGQGLVVPIRQRVGGDSLQQPVIDTVVAQVSDDVDGDFHLVDGVARPVSVVGIREDVPGRAIRGIPAGQSPVIVIGGIRRVQLNSLFINRGGVV